MKAIVVHEFGDASKLVYEDAAMPAPGPGEVRVKVQAAGLNFVEIYQRRGAYADSKTPATPGSEFAGIIDALGEGVTDLQVGDRVGTARGRGAYAEYAIAPAVQTVKIPDAVTLEQAAAVLLQGMTAHYLCFSTYPLKAGETALVHAAAGGVGLLLCQIAKRCGAQVIGTVSTEEKAELARGAGADHVILYNQQDFEAETKKIMNGKGVDVVYDSVGKDTFAKSMRVLRPRGYAVLYGAASGPVEPLDLQLLNRYGAIFTTRPTLMWYSLDRAEVLWRTDDLFNWMAAGELDVRIDKTFPLSDAASAHRYMEDRLTRGKVLIVP